MRENKINDVGSKSANRKKEKGSLAARIRQLLYDKDLKQNEFARALGVSANYIYLITSGRLTTISEPLAKLMETMYGYPSGWILGGERQPSALHEKDLRAGMIQRLKKMDVNELRLVAEYIESIGEDNDEWDGREEE